MSSRDDALLAEQAASRSSERLRDRWIGRRYIGDIALTALWYFSFAKDRVDEAGRGRLSFHPIEPATKLTWEIDAAAVQARARGDIVPFEAM